MASDPLLSRNVRQTSSKLSPAAIEKRVFQSFLASEDAWRFVLRDLVLDQIGEVAEKFAQLNGKYTELFGPGFFWYPIEIPQGLKDFLDIHSLSRIQWRTRKSYEKIVATASSNSLAASVVKSSILSVIDDLIKRMESPDKDFPIVIEYLSPLPNGEFSSIAICPRLLSIQKHQIQYIIKQARLKMGSLNGQHIAGISFHRRLSHEDIVHSLMLMETCRCRGNSPQDRNREEEWADQQIKMLDEGNVDHSAEALEGLKLH